MSVATHWNRAGQVPPSRQGDMGMGLPRHPGWSPGLLGGWRRPWTAEDQAFGWDRTWLPLAGLVASAAWSRAWTSRR